MYILAIDVGKGTEDIMLWDQKSVFENSIQMILPSRTQLLYRKLLHNESNWYFSGNIMAGEPWHKLVYEKCKNKVNSVIMTEMASRSLKYNQSYLINKGISIVSHPEFTELLKQDDNSSEFITFDIDWDRIKQIILSSGIKLNEISTILICCQDHGDPKGSTSSRDFRMKNMYEPSRISGKLEDLLMNLSEIPEYFPRLISNGKSALEAFPHLNQKNVFLMDSSPAVILGAHDKPNELIINVGNGHTVVCLFEDDELIFLYELHSGGLLNLQNDLNALLNGSLTHDESLRKGGHGVFYRKTVSLTKNEILPCTLIGPNRSKLKDIPSTYAHPGGSMMMAGPIGLIRAYQYNKASI